MDTAREAVFIEQRLVRMKLQSADVAGVSLTDEANALHSVDGVNLVCSVGVKEVKKSAAQNS